MLINLINNGFKFNRSEIRRVEVGWQAVKGNMIEVFVRDNGIGIEPQFQEQIFSIFSRLHTAREYAGTGVGLAVVKRAAQRIGAKLRVESVVGEGSTFYVHLPKTILEDS
jgi:signal transduction histidine kinase